uniref:Reverse transcriptase domain-containing protein n=1 Tax=Tanacetum cinerariifolium TaxID=118510 RepID=A0A699IE89_TANCI|nr:reverse transcriptase domain-containing protein [Tanacetum cinerariifolium]
MGGRMIHRMYVDGDSSMEILYEHCFNRLWPEIKNQMVSATTSLTDFSGETIWPLGQLRLLVTIGDADHSTRAWMNFMIVRSLSPYNGIIGRPRIREIQAVPSTTHGMLKFRVDGGIVTIRSTILIPAEYTLVITSSAVSNEEGIRLENFKIALHPDFPDQEVAIGGMVSAKGRTKLCSILKKNLDIFAWKPSDMTGVPRSVAEHRLSIREGYSPIRQKKRGQAVERAKAIQAEVQKLVEAGIMREVYYHDWLSNPVMDCFPLPEIDWKVESLCGYPFKCFLDAYKGYHQIQLAEPDEEKTTFHTGQGVYCYTKMPFGLKNAGATYQRLVDKASDSQIGRNIEVYVDDLVVKSYTEAEMLRDIDETFRTLRKINMKLNPKKCTFGTAEGVFLGYVVTSEGIKLCPDKTTVVLQLPFPRTIKEVQSLNWKLTREHNITYRPRTSVKGQILADFLTEMSDENPPAAPVVETQQEPWTLFTDGSSCVDGSGAGLILTNPKGIEFTYALRFQFAASNNEAEYEALIAGLRIAAQMRVQNVHVSVDSKLVANQVLGTYVAKEENMINYLDKFKRLVNGFTNFSISQVPRSKNKKAYALSKIASTSFAHLSKQVLVEILTEKSIKEKEVTTVVEEDGLTWMTPIVEYLKEGTLPGNRNEARKLRIKARYYGLLHEMIEAKAVPTIIGGQSNGLVERANRSLGEGIKAHLGEGNKNWVEKLPHVLWAHRTMIKSSHGNTPFSLTYGTEAVIPAEIEMPTYRTTAVDVVYNDGELRLNLDLLKERRERAAIREAKAKLKMTKYYNAQVRGVTFRLGDFVYRDNDASHAVAVGKLGPEWEGPYEVTEALGDGAYKLRSKNGTILPRTWNIANLKRCYL